MSGEERFHVGYFLLGMLVCGTMHLIWFVYPIAFLAIGVVQLVYVIPVTIWLKKKRRVALQQGVIAAAAITFLLNAACWGFVGAISLKL